MTIQWCKMTTSPRSGSNQREAHQPSEAFHRLHPEVQRWIWEQRWTELRDAQEAAVEPILAGDTDVIIAAATASGKTEAAFLPVCSSLLQSEDAASSGAQVLYVSPLKALINDQYDRLDQLCERLDIPVHRWHGDVPASRKAAFRRSPAGVLLITPESLEALFVNHGPSIPFLFSRLRYVLVDELHSFIGTERGSQLQSLLHRLELALRRRVPRIGLSATLGDMETAAEFLRPAGGAAVKVIVSDDDGQELRLQVRGYVARVPPRGAEEETDEVPEENLRISEHLFATLRGTDNLIFANSREAVERYADLLARLCEYHRVPNEFWPHHGSLSRDLREHAESLLKDRTLPVNVVCTSTLEMGLDIGSVSSIAQIGAPPSVAGLRQRLGRSGRRGGPAVLRLYVAESEIGECTAPPDALRAELVQSLAAVRLLLCRWYEPPAAGDLHISTLVQQLLSLIAQHGGVRAREAYSVLCGPGSFSGVTSATFAKLLRSLGAADYLTQTSDGTLLLGPAGERLVNHYSFYAAFATPQEYRLFSAGQSLGTLPVDHPIYEGSLLIFAGQRWRVLSVDESQKVVELVQAAGGRPPRFVGAHALVHDKVREEMLDVYQEESVPSFLEGTARSLLAEARGYFAQYRLAERSLLQFGGDTLLFLWAGDRVLNTVTVALRTRGLDVSQDGLAITVSGISPVELRNQLGAMLADGPPDGVRLAAAVANKEIEKYDGLLKGEPLDAAYAQRNLDPPAAWERLRWALQRTAPLGRTTTFTSRPTRRPSSLGGPDTEPMTGM